MDNTNIRKERGNSYQKNREISGWKEHINTWKLNWQIFTITRLSQTEESKCQYLYCVFKYIYSPLIDIKIKGKPGKV